MNKYNGIKTNFNIFRNVNHEKSHSLHPLETNIHVYATSVQDDRLINHGNDLNTKTQVIYVKI